MTLALNLVPEACRLAARRAARLRLWLAILLLAGLGVVLLHLHGQSRRWQLDETVRQLQQLTAEQQELDRQLNMVARTRQSLLERARALLEVYQGWPVLTQLSRLYTAVPQGVTLTQVAGDRGQPARARTAARPVRPARGKAAPKQVQPPQPQRLRFEIHGYAEDFAALSDLIGSLEGLPGWTSVRLLRAGRETLEGRTVVGFALEARVDPHPANRAEPGEPHVARIRGQAP